MAKFKKKPVIIEAITWDEFIEHGKREVGEENLTNGMPAGSQIERNNPLNNNKLQGGWKEKRTTQGTVIPTKRNLRYELSVYQRFIKLENGLVKVAWSAKHIHLLQFGEVG